MTAEDKINSLPPGTEVVFHDRPTERFIVVCGRLVCDAPRALLSPSYRVMQMHELCLLCNEWYEEFIVLPNHPTHRSNK